MSAGRLRAEHGFSMNVRAYLAAPLQHPWRGLAGALFVITSAMLLLAARSNRVGHDVSAAGYATLQWSGLVTSNGIEYGRFAIASRHRHPLSFHVNNIEIRTPQGWRYYASWSPGASRAHPKLGALDNPWVGPGQTQVFLAACPDAGNAWRIHVGVLRGVQGLTLENRTAILLKTHSLSAALTTNPRLMTSYHHFTFAGMLAGPETPRTTESRRVAPESRQP